MSRDAGEPQDDVKQVGRDLGVRHVLEGSVSFPSGGRPAEP